MGRTSKFTFPMPGRKQKPASIQPPADISAPLTKAQKILGTGELNIDSPIIPKDPSRLWDTKSNSGISISISESATNFTNDNGLGRLDEEEVVNGRSGRRARWEDESAIIPWAHHETSHRGNTAVGRTGDDLITDASSLRRQQSSSTINTYYDRSKVPLSISQQTASSAMAKGLPAKANALLDMNGSLALPPDPKKKKPSRLDLSHLLPKSMSSKHLSPSDAATKGLVLGPDMMTRSPSIMSVSPDTAPPPIQQRTNRKPRKKLTLETLRDHRLETASKPVPHDPVRIIRATASANELHNLYEHYEQRSFQEMMGGEPATRAEGGSPKYDYLQPSTSAARGFLSPYSNPSSRAALAARERSNSQASGDTPTTSLMMPSSLKSPRTDSASVSSRHTRTSKASKRTDRSMTDLDLRQNSVLSLSSDSEDDYGDRPNTSNTSLSVPPSSDAQSSPTSPNLNSFPQPPSPQMVDASSNKLPLRRAGPYGHPSPLESPPTNPGVAPPRIAARTSSLSISSAGTQKASTQNSTSRFSLASTATARSATAGPTLSPARREDSAIPHSRDIALIPAQGFRSPRQRTSRLSNGSDHPEPPLSPTSIDFYLQSQHNSMAFDNNSIRSRQSMGTTGGASIRSSTGSSIGGSESNGRFIAVTRQEEVLLAALRIKRARMREKMIAESEDGQHEAADAEGTPLHHPQPQHRYDQRTLQQLQNGPSQPLPDLPSRHRSSSESRRSSSRQMSRHSSLNTVRLAPLAEQPRGEQQAEQQPSPSAHLAPAPRYTNSSILEDGEERVLLYMDHPVGKMDAVDLTEPNPDLSDYLNFDEFPGVTSDAGSGSGSGKSQAPSGRSVVRLHETALFPAVPQGRSRKSHMNSLPKSNSASPSSQRQKVDDIHVRILEDGNDASSSTPDDNDIPRPDSPISPVVDLPLPTSQLPKKKQVRLSAVGYRPMEAGLWGDDG